MRSRNERLRQTDRKSRLFQFTTVRPGTRINFVVRYGGRDFPYTLYPGRQQNQVRGRGATPLTSVDGVPHFESLQWDGEF